MQQPLGGNIFGEQEVAYLGRLRTGTEHAAARAQQSEQQRRIGVLINLTPDDPRAIAYGFVLVVFASIEGKSSHRRHTATESNPEQNRIQSNPINLIGYKSNSYQFMSGGNDGHSRQRRPGSQASCRRPGA